MEVQLLSVEVGRIPKKEQIIFWDSLMDHFAIWNVKLSELSVQWS